MNTCGTCKYWKEALKDDRGNPPPSRFGVCEKEIGAVGSYPDIDGCIGDGRPEDGTGDGRTGPNFGCVHHEQI